LRFPVISRSVKTSGGQLEHQAGPSADRGMTGFRA
jgi:hypothetical protein